MKPKWQNKVELIQSTTNIFYTNFIYVFLSLLLVKVYEYCLRLYLFTSYRDLNLDTQLELLRTREYLEYTFHSIPEYKDGRYKGQWKNAKPHGM